MSPARIVREGSAVALPNPAPNPAPNPLLDRVPVVEPAERSEESPAAPIETGPTPDCDSASEVAHPAGSRGGRRWLALLVCLCVLLAGLSYYVWAWPQPEASSERPIVVSELVAAQAADAATASADQVLARNWNTYDADVDRAVQQLTPSFAEEFLATTSDAKAEFVAAKTTLKISVAWAGVTSGSAASVRVLVFLNQVIEKGTNAAAGAQTIPYRAVFTMVPGPSGSWLVSGIETQ